MSLPGSSNPVPPTVPEVDFNNVADLVACTTTNISWSTQNDPTDLTVYVSSYGFDTPDINVTLAVNIDPSSDTVAWSPISVPQGQYIVTGFYNGEVSQSNIFSVANGTDVSCLAGATPSPSPSDTATPSSSSTGATAPTGASDSGAASSGSSKSHAGAIAGGVIGGVILLLLIALGLFYFCRLSRRRRSANSNSAAGAGRWNGLASRDSNLHSTLPTIAAKGRGVPKGIRRQSAGANSVGNGAEPTSPVNSDEDLSTLAEEEKYVHAGALGQAYFNTAAPLPYTGYQHQHRRSSAGSNLNSPLSTASPSRAASTGSTTQNRAVALAKLDPAAVAPPKSPYGAARRQSLDGRVLSSPPASAAQTPTTPMTAPAEMIPMNINRSSSGPRRAARKPVPTYNPSEADVTSVNSASSGGPLMERGNSSSSGGHGRAATDSGTTLASHLHGGWKSREELVAAAPTLTHKSSFGDGRPVHYLIPDMPPPPRD